jgi:hypothetical protein
VLTPAFLLVAAAPLFAFLSTGVVLPVLPRYAGHRKPVCASAEELAMGPGSLEPSTARASLCQSSRRGKRVAKRRAETRLEPVEAADAESVALAGKYLAVSRLLSAQWQAHNPLVPDSNPGGPIQKALQILIGRDTDRYPAQGGVTSCVTTWFCRPFSSQKSG